MGGGFREGVWRLRAVALVVRDPISLRRDPDPGVRYDAGGLAVPDVSYAYADAVLDGICLLVCFVAYDGTLSWRSGDDVIESSFETVLSRREASRRYRTAISTELPDGLPRILREADAKLRTLRIGLHRDAGGPGDRGGLQPRAQDRRAAAPGDRATAVGCAAHRAQGRLEAGRVHQRAGRMDRGGEHGLRRRRHPPSAGGRVRNGGQDAAGVPADRRPLCAHAPPPASGTELALRPRRRHPARSRRHRPAGAPPRAPTNRGASTQASSTRPTDSRPNAARSQRSSR